MITGGGSGGAGGSGGPRRRINIIRVPVSGQGTTAGDTGAP